MLVFPQPTTGAAALYPVKRTTSTRTVANVLADDKRVKYSDADWRDRLWELRAIGLTREEWNAIRALHEAARGRLHSFTLLDPAGNLLARSEEFDAPEWNVSPLVTMIGGIADPFGTNRATRFSNDSAGAASVSQNVAAPGNFRYALSVWARGSGAISLVAATEGASARRDVKLTAEWKRWWVEVNLEQATESMMFGVELPASGMVVELFGMQAEAQLAPSAYRRTGAQGGVYQARFASDELRGQARGNDIVDTVIRLVSKGN